MKVFLKDGPHSNSRVDLEKWNVELNEDGTILSIDAYPLTDLDKLESGGLKAYEVGKSFDNHKYRLTGRTVTLDGDAYQEMEFVETVKTHILFDK